MNFAEREYYIARICAGFIKLDGGLLYKSASPANRFFAEEVYQTVYKEARAYGNFTEDELTYFLYAYELWDEERETRLDGHKKDLDELRTKTLGQTFQASELAKIKKAIQVTKEAIESLEAERAAYNYLTCEGVASIAKSRYLVGMSLYKGDIPVYDSADAFWRDDTSFLLNAMESYAAAKLNEEQIRELARTEPWRSLWSIREIDGLFDVPATKYTDEQKSLVLWSTFYDNIMNFPERPSVAVIDDDDLLDGWVILEKRKRDKAELEHGADSLLTDKTRNAQEVYLMAGSHEDAKKVEDLNDGIAKGIKNARMKYLFKHGKVNEVDMPDTQKRLRMEFVNLERQHFAGGK